MQSVELILPLNNILKALCHHSYKYLLSHALSASHARSYHHSPLRHYTKGSIPTTKHVDVPNVDVLHKEKASVLPKRNIYSIPPNQQSTCTNSPSRNTPPVTRRISATAQSVLGGVKSFLMPISTSTSTNGNNNNNKSDSGNANQSGIGYRQT